MNYELGELLRDVLLLCGAFIAASLILVANELSHYSSYSVHERFEDIYNASGMPILFLLGMLLLVAIFIKSIYAAYWGSKSIYTLLTLPVKREVLYLSKLCAFAISTMLLLCAQLIGFVLSYRYMVQKVASYSSGEFEMTNGLFLAFIRSDFMRLLWPYGAMNLISTVSICLVILTGVYYLAICERSRRKWGWVLLPVVLWLLIDVIGRRLEPVYEYSTIKVAINSVLLLAISVVFIWHSIHLMKKSAIV